MDIKKLTNNIIDFAVKRFIESLGLIISFLGLFLAVSFLTYSPEDPNFIFSDNAEIKKTYFHSWKSSEVRQSCVLESSKHKAIN